MKKLRYILATLMVAAIVAVVFVGCKKEKETPVQEASNNSDNQPNTEVVERKPIAVLDNNSGLINTFISVEAINEKLNESHSVFKGDANRFVVETIEVLDSVPHDKDVKGEIKIIILDTEEECSYSIWCMKSFIVKDVKEQQVDYYLDENVANGNFNIAFKEGDTYYIADFANDSLSIHKVDPLDYGCYPWYIFTCRSVDCLNSCDKEGTAFHASCKRCPYSDGECNADFSGSIGVLILAVHILKYFI